MISRLTFRQWSRCVDLGVGPGEAGMTFLTGFREMRRNVMIVQRAVLRDALAHGAATYRTTINMGEGCTPIKRIDPADFYAAPEPPQ